MMLYFHNISLRSSRVSLPGEDFPEPPQCEPASGALASPALMLVDGSRGEEAGAAGRSPAVTEEAAEAAEFFDGGAAADRRSHRVSLKADKSNAEGGVVIEMSTQPLLERAPTRGMWSLGLLYSPAII